jgi:hypothetical protein
LTEAAKYRAEPGKGQHFLLSPLANSLRIAKVAVMKEEDAYRWCMLARWYDNKGELYCPACGNLDVRSIRRKCFRCTAAERGREVSQPLLRASAAASAGAPVASTEVQRLSRHTIFSGARRMPLATGNANAHMVAMPQNAAAPRWPYRGPAANVTAADVAPMAMVA